MNPALRARDLHVTYHGPRPVHAVNGIDLDVAPGECHGVLGESGSGKSTLARCLLGLADGASLTGSIRWGTAELVGREEAAWQPLRWRDIALVFQSTAALNPVLRVVDQVAEPLVVHQGRDVRDARRRARQALEQAGLPATLADRHPHEMSGGQRRLALVAMALVCDPGLLVLDEPTAGLDALTRTHIVEVVRRLRAQQRTIVVLSHDVDLLEDVTDRVSVLYRGTVAETGPTDAVLHTPRHPYTFGLLNARPRLGGLKELRGIRGAPPDATDPVRGCAFTGRCTQEVAMCTRQRPAHVVPEGGPATRTVACVRGGLVPVVRARGLRKTYRVRQRGRGRTEVLAVDDVDLDVHESETVGLVGPNGAGKSTLGQLLLRLVDADAGRVEIEGTDLLNADRGTLQQVRARAQMLFQDPYEALSPRLTVRQAVREPLDVQDVGSTREREARVAETLRATRVPPDAGILDRHTHELSGGQLQRVALARALVLRPKLLVADEPLAGLDPSEQAKLLQLLKHLQVERGMAMVLVSHDLAVVLRCVDRVVVMDRGRVVERASSTDVLTRPAHPTTRRLVEAAGGGPFITVDPTPTPPPEPDHAGART